MATQPTWTKEAEKFWSEVRLILRGRPDTRGRAEELVEAYRSALASRGVSDGLIFHQGAIEAADAAAQQPLRESADRF